jgi:putative transposase
MLHPASAPGARVRYHLIGHSAHHRETFARTSAAAAVEQALAATCILNGWTAHAFVFLPHRYQLAVDIPSAADPRAALPMLETHVATGLQANLSLVRGPRQLNCTARLIDSAAAFATVIDHIHLEPVRAGLIAPAHLAAYPGGSLRPMLQVPRPPWLDGSELLRQHQLADTTTGWSTYLARLMHASMPHAVGGDPPSALPVPARTASGVRRCPSPATSFPCSTSWDSRATGD